MVVLATSPAPSPIQATSQREREQGRRTGLLPVLALRETALSPSSLFFSATTRHQQPAAEPRAAKALSTQPRTSPRPPIPRCSLLVSTARDGPNYGACGGRIGRDRAVKGPRHPRTGRRMLRSRVARQLYQQSGRHQFRRRATLSLSKGPSGAPLGSRIFDQQKNLTKCLALAAKRSPSSRWRTLTRPSRAKASV